MDTGQPLRKYNSRVSQWWIASNPGGGGGGGGAAVLLIVSYHKHRVHLWTCGSPVAWPRCDVYLTNQRRAIPG